MRLFINTDSYKKSIIYKQLGNTPETNVKKTAVMGQGERINSVTILQCEQMTEGMTRQYGIV